MPAINLSSEFHDFLKDNELRYITEDKIDFFNLAKEFSFKELQFHTYLTGYVEDPFHYPIMTIFLERNNKHTAIFTTFSELLSNNSEITNLYSDSDEIDCGDVDNHAEFYFSDRKLDTFCDLENVTVDEAKGVLEIFEDFKLNAKLSMLFRKSLDEHFKEKVDFLKKNFSAESKIDIKHKIVEGSRCDVYFRDEDGHLLQEMKLSIADFRCAFDVL